VASSPTELSASLPSPTALRSCLTLLPQLPPLKIGLDSPWRLQIHNGLRSAEDDELSSCKKKHDFVHLTLTRNKAFLTVTDVAGNRKTGASAGCLGSEDKKGRGRLSRYAADATAEYVGRAAKKMGIKSVVVRMKGTIFFGEEEEENHELERWI
jgi:ribosomal protein S11